MVKNTSRPVSCAGVLKPTPIDVNEEHDRSRMQVAEHVAVSRGANLRLCASVADAEAWLRSERDQRQSAW